MKCGEGHSTHECDKPRTTAPKCANCGGEHLSTSIKCTKNPNNPSNRPIQAKNKPAQIPQENPWKKQTEAKKSMKDEPPKKNTQKATRTDEEEILISIGRMAVTFSETNPTAEQYVQFQKEQQKMINIFKKMCN